MKKFLVILMTICIVTSNPILSSFPTNLDKQKVETSKNIINQVFITINLNNTNNTVIPVKLDDFQNNALKICDNENSTNSSNSTTERPPTTITTDRPSTTSHPYFTTTSKYRPTTIYPTYPTTYFPWTTYTTQRPTTHYPWTTTPWWSKNYYRMNKKARK
ncbi:uncharacterized protein LOC127288093 [Leptopilina boulardi]|uniref:uncharacterized protein LOC127288093 n=1 Tax=Leptopilina boulardi TaxID=63433 RepID=UPI0021F5FE37|nr:uncharacterized protein LOC127288093 [Leptopilina boulardi]